MKAKHILVGLVALAGAASGCAASAQGADGGWHYLVEPYLMFPNMKGDIGLGNLPSVHIDESPDDIFSNLQIGAMLYAEAHNERWAFASDIIYMDLESGISERTLIAGGKAEAAQLGWELWQGPLAGRRDSELLPTPEQTGIMILRLARTPPLDLGRSLVVEYDGRIW